MDNTSKILRRSIFTFLQNYQFFTTTATLLAFPFAASILLLQSLLSSSSSASFLPIIHTRIHSLFDAAGFPSSSLFFSFLNTKLSQAIAISVLAFPSTLSSFLFSKASVIHALQANQESPKIQSFSCFFNLYPPLIHTQILNSLITLSANATSFFLLFIAFNLGDGLGLSLSSSPVFLLSGALIFSIIVANTFIICNLALILSGAEENGGLIAILKACVLIKGRTTTALSLALPINAAMAAVEALFQYRVVSAYYDDGAETGVCSLALEGMFIAYLYAVLLVLDTIVGFFFFRSCQMVKNTEIQYQNHCKTVKIVEDIP